MTEQVFSPLKTSPRKDRWRAKIVYRTENGPVDVEHDLFELSELEYYVEAGPHWDTVIVIEITRINHVDSPDLTVEDAGRL
jgi:hypothetical protein